MTENAELRRVYWHSRRGMLELDLLLSPFARERYPLLDQADQELYRRLLECEDNDLYRWLVGSDRPDDDKLGEIVRLIREQ